ncbi:MAG: 50S ribosomal protein L18 [Methylococcales bacterium]|jgi:large subunit ribosomal protein L18|nr:50S ribosomal protein L18 [Methylococcales bacterium]
MNKKKGRIKRSIKTRKKISILNVNRLTIHRTSKHMYAQIISPCGSKVIACANTLQKKIIEQIEYSGNKNAAAVVGENIAKLAIESGITSVAFDRSGFKYHGRVKALADAARENGLKF